MADDAFVYAVTRVHANEQNLLSGADVDQMVAAPDAAAVLRILSDKGWSVKPGDAMNPAPLLAQRTREAWQLMNELVGDVPEFDVLRVQTDYHNLKAAIKLAYSAGDMRDESYYLQGGNVELDAVIKAAAEHNFDKLPDRMAQAGRDAYEALAHTGNGQQCDMILDRACLIAIGEAAKDVKSPLLHQYADMTIDLANIKAAVRACRQGRDRAFLERAIAPAGTLDAKDLMDAAAISEDKIYNYLRTTRYAGAVDALEKSMTAFERWANNLLIETIRPQRSNYFTIEPLVAYILARENEIAMVRIILSAKINGLDDDVLRERLREMYV